MHASRLQALHPGYHIAGILMIQRLGLLPRVYGLGFSTHHCSSPPDRLRSENTQVTGLQAPIAMIWMGFFSEPINAYIGHYSL